MIRREDSLEYHGGSAARQDRAARLQAVPDPAGDEPRVPAGGGLPVPGDRRRPRGGLSLHRARQPGRRGDERNRRAGARLRRAARRQADAGGDRRPVQAARRHRRLRPRDRRAGARVLRGDRAAARAHVRRHQPQGRPRPGGPRHLRAAVRGPARSRCSTRTSTARRWSRPPRCSTRSSSWASGIEAVRVVLCGAGTVGTGCARLLLSLGVHPDNLLVYDVAGLLHPDRAGPARPPARVRPRTPGAPARGRRRGRRRVPRGLRRRRPDPGHDPRDGAGPGRAGARDAGAGDRVRGGAREPAGRDRRHEPRRLPERRAGPAQLPVRRSAARSTSRRPASRPAC